MKANLSFELDGSHMVDNRGFPLYQEQAERLLRARQLADLVGVFGVILGEMSKAYCAAGQPGVAAAFSDLGDGIQVLVEQSGCAVIAASSARDCIESFRLITNDNCNALNKLHLDAYQLVNRMSGRLPGQCRSSSAVFPCDEGSEG